MRLPVLMLAAVALLAWGDNLPARAAGPLDAARALADKGAHAAAIKAYSTALNGGALSANDTARGFYLRGVSYAKSRKNPQAISDLTNSLWLSGLSNEERANAYRMRASAYKASGLKKKAAADLKKAGGAGTPALASDFSATVTPAPASKVAKKTVKVASAQKLAPSSVSGTSSGGWASQTSNAAASAKPTASKPAPGASPAAGNAVTNFFSGIFSGGTPAPAPVQAKPKKPAVNTAFASGTSSSTTGAGTAVSSWSSQVATKPARKVVVAKKPVKIASWNTNVAAKPVKRKTRVAARKVVAKKAVRKKGRFNVQVATVRDKAAAEQIAKTISAKSARALAGLSPSIDRAVLGNMGTFYRVRVDGLASRQASANLCKVLLKSGHDCFLIGR